VALAGCGSDRDSPGSEPASGGPATVDERAGTYHGVGIGSTREEARREFGRVESGPTDPLALIGKDPPDVGVPGLAAAPAQLPAGSRSGASTTR
jgi:hypothetical protein